MRIILDNTEKLLRAFIEASGYEVEEVINENTSTYELALESAIKMNDIASLSNGIIHLLPLPMEFYTTDYKVTKKSAPIDGNKYNLCESNWK